MATWSLAFVFDPIDGFAELETARHPVSLLVSIAVAEATRWATSSSATSTLRGRRNGRDPAWQGASRRQPITERSRRTNSRFCRSRRPPLRTFREARPLRRASRHRLRISGPRSRSRSVTRRGASTGFRVPEAGAARSTRGAPNCSSSSMAWRSSARRPRVRLPAAPLYLEGRSRWSSPGTRSCAQRLATALTG